MGKHINRYKKIMVYSTIVILVTTLLWCKLDGVVSESHGFQSTERIHNVQIISSLRPSTMKRQQGLL